MLKCSECGKELGILDSFRNPVAGSKKIVCSCCWNKIDEIERKYTSFILNSVNNKDNGFISYILIKVVPTFEMEIYNKIKNLPNMIEIYPLMGLYDFIIKIKVENYNELGTYVVNNIRRINGISSTNTLTGAFSLTGKK